MLPMAYRVRGSQLSSTSLKNKQTNKHGVLDVAAVIHQRYRNVGLAHNFHIWYQTNNLLTIMCKMLCALSLRDLFDGADFLPV